MKTKVLTLTGLFFLALGLNVQAKDADLFRYDAAKLDKDFQQVNKVEKFVKENQGVTLDELKKQKPSMVKGLNLSNSNSSILGSILPEPPLGGIPSFIWGLCLGPLGILLVYIITESKDETMKALWGGISWLSLFFKKQILNDRFYY